MTPSVAFVFGIVLLAAGALHTAVAVIVHRRGRTELGDLDILLPFLFFVLGVSLVTIGVS